MVILSTGPINNFPVNGIRPTQRVTVKISNQSSTAFSDILLRGQNLTSSTQSPYVLELFKIDPNQVITKNFYANLDSFEFIFTVFGSAAQIGITVWGKSDDQLVPAHRFVLTELNQSEE